MSRDREPHSLDIYELYLVFDLDFETNADLEKKFNSIIAGHYCSAHTEHLDKTITIQAQTSSLACFTAIRLTFGSYIKHSGRA